MIQVTLSHQFVVIIMDLIYMVEFFKFKIWISDFFLSRQLAKIIM